MSVLNWLRNASGLFVPYHTIAKWRFLSCFGCTCEEEDTGTGISGGFCCIEVTFSATANCIGGTYNLEQINSTLWQCSAYNSCFSSNPQTMQVALTESAGTYYVTVTVDGHTWEKSYVSEPALCEFLGESISHDSSGGCNTSGTSCELTGTPIDDDCPDCGEATCETTWCRGFPTQIAVDFGVGGWVDANCNACDEYADAGEYILTTYSSCSFRYTSGSTEICIYNAPTATKIYCIILYEYEVVDAGAGTIRAKCTFSIASLAGLGSTVIYYSDAFPKCSDCFPQTLTKSSEVHHPTYPACSGTMPNTITADIA